MGLSLKSHPATIKPTQKSRRLKNFAAEAGVVRDAYPEAEVEAWAQDEHHLGPKPVLRKRVWSRHGPLPVAPLHHRYEWLYVYGFVRPATGQTF